MYYQKQVHFHVFAQDDWIDSNYIEIIKYFKIK